MGIEAKKLTDEARIQILHILCPLLNRLTHWEFKNLFMVKQISKTAKGEICGCFYKTNDNDDPETHL